MSASPLESQRHYSRRRAIMYVALAACLTGCNRQDWSSQSIATTKRTGDAIIGALTRYHDDHHVYPSTLNELVPTYLNAIDPPAVGPRHWDYSRENNGSCILVVGDEAGSNPLMYRVPDGRLWIIDTK